MKTIFDYNPGPITDLGDGTYLENSNIEEFIDEETGATQWRADTERKRFPKPITPDTEVEVWRLRAVLELAGLTETVTTILENVSGPEGVFARSIWQLGGRARRGSATILFLADALGLTPEEVDELFIQADSAEI